MAKKLKSVVKWVDIAPIHEENIHRCVVGSLGNFGLETAVRKEVLEAIHRCDLERLKKIHVSGYSSQQVSAKLREHGAYQYAENSINERRAVIEHHLNRNVPKPELPVVKAEIFNALENGVVEVVSTKISPYARRNIRQSGLADYIDIKL